MHCCHCWAAEREREWPAACKLNFVTRTELRPLLLKCPLCPKSFQNIMQLSIRTLQLACPNGLREGATPQSPNRPDRSKLLVNMSLKVCCESGSFD